MARKHGKGHTSNRTNKRSQGNGNAALDRRAAMFRQAFNAAQYAKALTLADELCRGFPREPIVWELAANAYGRLGRLREAADAMQRAVELAGGDPRYRLKQAQYQVLAGQADEALDTLKTQAEAEPSKAEAWVWLSRAYHALGASRQALEANDRAQELEPSNEEMLLWRSRIFQQLKRPDDELITLQRLLEVAPRRVGVHSLMGGVALREGDYLTAERHFQEELSLSPENPLVYSSLLAAGHYNPAYSERDLFEKAREWDKRFAQPVAQSRADTPREPERRLKVGLLSAGFKMHPVGHMVLPALRHLAPERFELCFYSMSQRVDPITEQLKELAHQWDVVEGLSDAELDRKIRSDGIDILIDMAGTDEGSRQLVMARQPAPLQVKWVGMLIGTTGLSSMDYLLSDSIETPEGVDALYTEKLIRLPDDYICYHVPPYAPKVTALPALANGYITFGCLNNPAKLSPPLLREWAQLMHEVPNSRLLLRGVQFERDEFRRRIAERFARHGITADRLIMEGPAKHDEFLATYQRIDIALDTWPYSGGLTTCEALLMGVPVVTRTGPTFAGRHSATHLANAGLPELVTDTWEDFRRRAKELVADLPNLALIRAALRTILTHSPVCDGPRFATHLTTALRAIWQRHCAGKAPAALTFDKEGTARFADEDGPVELVEVDGSSNMLERFDWELEGPITILDNAAVLPRELDFPKWMASGHLAVICFDPASLLNDRVEDLKQFGEFHHYPHALLGDGKPATLYVTLDAEKGSTLHPLPAERQPAHLREKLQVLVKVPVNTVALDQIEGLPNVDMLVLDDLHDAMSILQNGQKALKDTLLIKVKVAFQPTHERQPNLAELQHWASRNGFRFYCFTHERFHSYLPESVPPEKRQASELESTDALFLPSQERMQALSNASKMKLAFMLSKVFEVHDVSFDVIASVDQERAVEFLEAQGFIPTSAPRPKDRSVPAPASPPIPQSSHVKGEPVVSVICATYNHANFIEDAIKGFIAQETDFPFEVIIHDDASTDGTQEVIRRYAEQYPELIRPIYQKVNQYSRNRKPHDICLPLTKGRYVAICEGDDYWTDSRKLQTQFDYMEQHPSCVVTHHNAFVFDGEMLVKESKLPEFFERSFGQDELLKNECFILTLSMMYRKKFDEFPKEKGKVRNGDNFLISMLGLYGNSAYLANIKPAAYRLHKTSVWSSRNGKEKSDMLAESFYWIGKYHERKMREGLANLYYSKSSKLRSS